MHSLQALSICAFKRRTLTVSVYLSWTMLIQLLALGSSECATSRSRVTNWRCTLDDRENS